MGKKALIVVVVLVLLSSVLGLVLHTQKDRVVRSVTESVIADATGFDVAIGTVDTRIQDCAVTLLNIELTNPPQFEVREAFRISRVYAQATLKTILKQEQHLKQLQVKVESMTVVRNPDGESNMDRLSGETDLFAGRSDWSATFLPLAALGLTADVVDGGDEVPVDLVIDELSVYIGDVHMVDHVLGRDGKPFTMDYTVDEERLFYDVTDMEQVVKEMSVAMAVSSMSKNLGGLLSPEALKKMDEKAPELMESLMEFMGESSSDEKQDAGDALKDALESLFR